jgi:hypothetical protein
MAFPGVFPKEMIAQLRARRGGIIAALLFAGILLLVATLAVGIVVTKAIRIKTVNSGDGADISIGTPDGRLDIRAREHMNPALAGIPVYPGAWREKDGEANIEWNSRGGDSDNDLYVTAGVFLTRDSVSQVVDFYRRQLPGRTLVSWYDRFARLEYRDGGTRRVIVIHGPIHGGDGAGDGETRIGFASIGGRASN